MPTKTMDSKRVCHPQNGPGQHGARLAEALPPEWGAGCGKATEGHAYDVSQETRLMLEKAECASSLPKPRNEASRVK